MPEERLDDMVGPPARHVLVTDLDGEVTLYDSVRSEVHALNETASEIWRLLDERRRFDDVLGRFAAAHGVDPDSVRASVTETISRFVELGLLADPAAE
jgi:PqqD family protein of HPr-rel-A system